MSEKYTVRQDGSGAWQVWSGLDTCLRPQALACDAEALADALNSAHAAGLATAQAELKELREALADMLFAYTNKDADCPHGFEAKAVAKARELLSRTLTDSTHALEEE